MTTTLTITRAGFDAVLRAEGCAVADNQQARIEVTMQPGALRTHIGQTLVELCNLPVVCEVVNATAPGGPARLVATVYPDATPWGLYVALYVAMNRPEVASVSLAAGAADVVDAEQETSLAA